MHTKNLTCKILLLVARILMIAVVAFAFYYVWRGNYWPEMLIPFGKRGIWVFILIYVMVYFLLTKIYGAFRVGKAKVSEIAYSQVITLFLLNGFTYCLIGEGFGSFGKEPFRAAAAALEEQVETQKEQQ